MALQALTANRLGDGVVVYMTRDGGWTETLDQAHAVEAGEAAEALLSEGEAAALEIVGPYLIDIVKAGPDFAVASVRERIRAAGPSVRTDHGKQAGQ